MEGRSTCGCVRERVTFWPPEHIVRDAQPLLQGPGEFCTTFFHVLPCTEFNITHHVCLRANARQCHHQCISIIARLQSDEDPVGIAVRYTTCRLKSGAPVHAEEFLVGDAEFDARLGVAGAHVTIYGQVQPCHHSGGSDAYPKEALSCSERIRDWYLSRLRPRGVGLTIRCANLYKAMWRFSPSDLVNTPSKRLHSASAARAREGLRLLADSGIPVHSIDPEGWRFLTGLADLSAAEKKLESSWPARLEADRQIEAFLAEIPDDAES